MQTAENIATIGIVAGFLVGFVCLCILLPLSTDEEAEFTFKLGIGAGLVGVISTVVELALHYLG